MVKNLRVTTFLLILFNLTAFNLSAQKKYPIAEKVQQLSNDFKSLDNSDLVELLPDQNLSKSSIDEEIKDGTLLSLNVNEIQKFLKEPSDLLKFSIPLKGANSFDLELYKAKVFTDDFKVYAASNPNQPYAYNHGAYYWGVVNGNEHSLASIAIYEGEIMGLIHVGGEVYNLGKLAQSTEGTHVLYKGNDLEDAPALECSTSKAEHVGSEIGQLKSGGEKSADNCVKMYVEVDYDIVVQKGGVTEATNYVTGAVSQVAILYANESINFTLNELLVWDVTDPYIGPSTSQYLTQFRDQLSGNYNGDLAHLVGYQGGGGIAYVDALCSKTFSVGYSDIASSYSNVPAYSWTVEVLAHEIGHNLGSPHTHDCVWNGNNTAIDGCGPTAGYGNSCGGGPIPSKGTVMSYCHLLSGVGIDFNLGFGQQPGDLIRNRVYNANCLGTCAAPLNNDAGIVNIVNPTGQICGNTAAPQVLLYNYGSVALTTVTINYQLDGGTTNAYNWTGSLAPNSSTSVTLPNINFGIGNHDFSASTSNPNGGVDADGTNDSNSSSFTRLSDETYYADNDGDGYGNADVTITDCTLPSGYATNGADCNDSDSTAYFNAPCNDGDVCTENDVLDINCNCAGTAVADSDDDGVCDVLDVCAGFDDALIGTACNDGDSCTINDVYTNNCGCAGTPVGDSDDDGVCDALDVCAGFDDALIGTACNDGDSCTINDVYGNDCGCAGTPVGDSDDDGVCDALDVCADFDDALIGTACDDGDSCTINDTYVMDCNCVGTPSDDSDNDGICDPLDTCPDFDNALIGTACDDGNVCTINDVYGNDCNCVGTPTNDSDGDGVCDADDMCADFDDALIGTTCDDGDSCTINDIYEDCGCIGTPAGDSDDDGVCDVLDVCAGFDDALIGTACNDGDSCTINDVYTNNCGCAGTPAGDSDDDGVCDVLDVCPDFDDALIGMPCDDGDSCTINDIYEDCGCIGTPAGDSDDDGVCDVLDVCAGFDDALIGTACNDGDSCTINDVYTNNCDCAGTPAGDSDNDGVCDVLDVCADFDDALIGTACDDGDSCTINDVYEDCGCVGTPADDSDNDGVCDVLDVCPDLDDALIGMPCDDGDACTINDVYGSDCGCTGTPTNDSDGDGVCDGEDICPNGDDNLDEDENGVPDLCDCIPSSFGFSKERLRHKQSGSRSSIISFAPGSKDVSFVITDLSAKTNGKKKNRYIEQVTVEYVDGNGTIHEEGVYYGDEVDSVSVYIDGEVSFVKVTLEDAYDGYSSKWMTVYLSQADYCNGCADGDGDGVCDEVDVCPNGDDNLDENGDNIPDACESIACDNEEISFFDTEKLTHKGEGSSSKELFFAPGTQNVSFTIRNLNAKWNNNPALRYIEQVSIDYVNGNGVVVHYGAFFGANQNNVHVSIPDYVQSVEITLKDIYDGDTEDEKMSVKLSEVLSCVDLQGLVAGDGGIGGLTVYPNPASQFLNLRFDDAPEEAEVELYNMLGVLIQKYKTDGAPVLHIDLGALELRSQNILMVVKVPGRKLVTKRVSVIH